MNSIYRTFKLCIVNGIEKLTIGAKCQTRSLGFGFSLSNNPNTISNNVFKRGNLQIEPAWKYGGMARYLTTKNIPDKPVSTGQVNNVNEDLADVKNQLKSIGAEIKALMDEWEKAGDKFPKKDQLASLKAQRGNLINQRNKLETKLNEQPQSFQLPDMTGKFSIKTPHLTTMKEFVEPDEFIDFRNLLARMITKDQDTASPNWIVPMVVGPMGSGKTTMVHHGVFKAVEICSKLDGSTDKQWAVGVAYFRVDHLIKDMRDWESVAAVNLLARILVWIATGSNRAFPKDERVTWMSVREPIGKSLCTGQYAKGMPVLVLGIDETQANKDLVRKLIDACATTMYSGSPPVGLKVIPVPSGVLLPNQSAFQSNISTHVFRSQLPAEGLRASFSKSIGLCDSADGQPRSVGPIDGPLNVLFNMCGNVPRIVETLVEVINIKKKEIKTDWKGILQGKHKLAPPYASTIREDVVRRLNAINDKAKWLVAVGGNTDPVKEKFGTNAWEEYAVIILRRLLIDVVLQIHVDLNSEIIPGADGVTYKQVQDAGLFNYDEQSQTLDFSMFGLWNLNNHVPVMPADLRVFHEDYHGNEMIAMFSLYLVVLDAQLRGEVEFPLTRFRRAAKWSENKKRVAGGAEWCAGAERIMIQVPAKEEGPKFHYHIEHIGLTAHGKNTAFELEPYTFIVSAHDQSYVDGWASLKCRIKEDDHASESKVVYDKNIRIATQVKRGVNNDNKNLLTNHYVNKHVLHKVRESVQCLLPTPDVIWFDVFTTCKDPVRSSPRLGDEFDPKKVQELQKPDMFGARDLKMCWVKFSISYRMG